MNYTNQIINKFGSDYKIKGDDMCFPCPYHNGNSYNSFKVSVSKGVYKCFNCGASGHVMEGVKLTTPYIPAPKIEEPVKEFKQVKPSNDGYFAFKKYIKTRQIDIELDNFNLRDKFSYYYSEGVHHAGLLVGDKARYTYYLHNDYTKKNKIWKKGSQATPFYFTHKDFKECKNLYIFEGIEDCLAFMELWDIDFASSKFCIIFGVNNIHKVDFSELSVDYKFCIDNDKAGMNMVRDAFSNNKDIKFNIYKPDGDVKDFNDELIIAKKELEAKQKEIKEEPKVEELKQDQELTLEELANAYNIIQNKDKEELKVKLNLDDNEFKKTKDYLLSLHRHLNKGNIKVYNETEEFSKIQLIKQIARC